MQWSLVNKHQNNRMMKTLIVFLAVVAIVAASGYTGYDENGDGLNDR
jgi:hypothetical protein